MKKSLGLGSLLIIGGLIAVVLMVGGNYASQFIFGNSPDLVELDAEPVRHIKINSESTAVQLVPADGDQLKSHLEQRSMFGQYQMKVNTTRDTVEIEVERKGLHLNILGFFRSSLTVHLPEKIWESLEVEVASGLITADQVTAEELSLTTSSGNLELSELQAEELKVTAGSGNITLVDVAAADLDATVGSGNLVVDGFTTDQFKFQSGSGRVDLTSGEGELAGSTGSGDISLTLDQLLHPVSLEAGSGRLKVDAEQILANLDLKVGSGSIDVNVSDPDTLNVDYSGRSGASIPNGFHYTTQNDNRIIGYFGSEGSGATLNAQTGSGSFSISTR